MRQRTHLKSETGSLSTGRKETWGEHRVRGSNPAGPSITTHTVIVYSWPGDTGCFCNFSKLPSSLFCRATKSCLKGEQLVKEFTT